MKNNVFCAVTETQTHTPLLFCKKVNKQMVKLGKYFVDFNFRGSRLSVKYRENWMTQKFLFYSSSFEYLLRNS